MKNSLNNKKVIIESMDIIRFQIIDWNQYHESEDNDDMNSSDDNEYNKNINLKYKIRIFGKTDQGKSIYVNINNYTPFFYVKIPNEWNLTKVISLVNYLKSKISNQNLNKGLINFEIVERKDLYGFTGYKNFKFLRLIFDKMKFLNLMNFHQ